MLFLEDSRRELVNKGRRGQKEKTDHRSRYEKRKLVTLSSSNQEYNKIDMNELFKEDILTIKIPVVGETANYTTTVKFGGFLQALRQRVKANQNRINPEVIGKALRDAFDRNNVYISCSCADWRYRGQYWATVTDINAGEKQTIPSDITNPHNLLGPGCKHIMLVISDSSWRRKVSSVINNYIKYVEIHRPKEYASVIYPAVFGEKYTGPVQQTLDDLD